VVSGGSRYVHSDRWNLPKCFSEIRTISEIATSTKEDGSKTRTIGSVTYPVVFGRGVGERVVVFGVDWRDVVFGVG
jgi:hypothetical protein